MRYLTIELCKKQAIIDYGDDDDELIVRKATAAEEFVENQVNRPLSELEKNGELPAGIIEAMLMFFTSSYNNRDALAAVELKFVPSFIALIQPYKKYGNP